MFFDAGDVVTVTSPAEHSGLSLTAQGVDAIDLDYTTLVSVEDMTHGSGAHAWSNWVPWWGGVGRGPPVGGGASRAAGLVATRPPPRPAPG